MRIMLCWVLVGCGWGVQASAAELFTTIIPKGSTWRYYDSDPSLRASDWNAVVFNDEQLVPGCPFVFVRAEVI